MNAFSKNNGGQGWIRTSVHLREQIYSLPPLTTRPPTHRRFRGAGCLFSIRGTDKQKEGEKFNFLRLQRFCTGNQGLSRLCVAVFGVSDARECSKIDCGFLCRRFRKCLNRAPESFLSGLILTLSHELTGKF